MRLRAITFRPVAEKDIATNVQDSYTAKDLAVLEGLDAVRKRPGMYIGSTDSRGLLHCLWEIIDNSVDESLAGHCKKIEINLESDGSVEVHDDGRGIPVDKEPKTGLTGVEVVLTKLHAGGKFGGGSYAASGGLHGVGASVVNALASRLDAEVDRDGKIYWMSFQRGVAGIFDGDGPKAPFEPKSGLRVIGKISSKVTGTRIKWWSDRQIFLKDAELDLEEIYARARQTSYLVPGLTLIVNDNRTKTKQQRLSSTRVELLNTVISYNLMKPWAMSFVFMAQVIIKRLSLFWMTRAIWFQLKLSAIWKLILP